MTSSLSQAVILITGATGGIGSALVPRLAQAGSHLVLTARRAEPLQALVEKAAALGAASGLGIPVDVTDYAQVEALVAQTVQKHGRIDVLINLAGAGILKPAPQITPEDLEQMLSVNLKGSFYTSQWVANHMREQKSGHILNFPGILGRHPMAMASAYCAAKFAVVGFSKCMADELKRFGVRFTLFYFGGVDSPFWDPISLKVQRDKMLSPATAAEAIQFALSAPANAVPSEVVLQPESHQFL
ncbi:SDR family oxidoreductase [Synechococcus sp. Nb3U1]|uniref:SDR family oxidoreductase n=1 Tax=Synechococcus sp. Nb3U1 TaxID=1914529 RepID=UPI001F30B1FB|nr:SDR family oxidoreductase [Synechococcus sp. Nb3U1]MCF2970092.1 SDR family oxidoreductase [Synechococcus sp. Nb3U1]